MKRKALSGKQLKRYAKKYRWDVEGIMYAKGATYHEKVKCNAFAWFAGFIDATEGVLGNPRAWFLGEVKP